jgi:DHA1 family tetracycline resistance protein-like MFS transporter
VRPPALLVVCLAVFVDMLGFGIILPLLPFHVAQLGGSGAWIGAMLTAYAAAQFVAAPVLGSLSDRYGRRRLLLTSLAGSAVSMTLTGLAGSLVLLVLARAFAGACGGSIGVAQAYVVDLAHPKDRIRALGAVGASIGFGFVIGPAVGAGLAGLGVGFAGACFAAAAIAAANVALGLFLLPVPTTVQSGRVGHARSDERGDQAEAPAASPGRTGRLASLRFALRRTSLRPVLIAIFATTFAFAGMETTFAYLGATRFGLGPAGLGLVFAAVGLVLIVVQGGLVGVLADRYGDQSVAVAGAVLLAMSLLLLPFAPAGLAYAALGFLALGQGLLSTTTAALIARVADNGRAKLGGALGIGQSAAAAARGLGPLTAGVAYDFALPLPYVFGAVLCGAAAILLAAVRDEQDRGTEPRVVEAVDRPRLDHS